MALGIPSSNYLIIMLYFVELSSASKISSKFVIAPCIEDAECAEFNGKCVNNKCYCNNSYTCKNEHTLVNKLEESCKSSSDCNMDSAICDERNQCSCIEGYIQSYNKRKCLRIAKGLGDECEDALQCYTKIPSTGCHENKCVCQRHMHEHNGTCYKNVELGQACQLIGECSLIPNASCLKSECRCLENYVSNGSTCLLKANGINFTCIDDIQCTAQLNRGSKCFDGMCKCEDLYNYKASINQCVYDLLLNEACEKHSDCHQPGNESSKLECVLGVCKCKSPFMEESGYCISSSTSAVIFNSIILFIGTIFLMK